MKVKVQVTGRQSVRLDSLFDLWILIRQQDVRLMVQKYTSSSWIPLSDCYPVLKTNRF